MSQKSVDFDDKRRRYQAFKIATMVEQRERAISALSFKDRYNIPIRMTPLSVFLVSVPADRYNIPIRNSVSLFPSYRSQQTDTPRRYRPKLADMAGRYVTPGYFSSFSPGKTLLSNQRRWLEL
ncbi:unnamed protein product [Cochlearia groenlandica]